HQFSQPLLRNQQIAREVDLADAVDVALFDFDADVDEPLAGRGRYPRVVDLHRDEATVVVGGTENAEVALEDVVAEDPARPREHHSLEIVGWYLDRADQVDLLDYHFVYGQDRIVDHADVVNSRALGGRHHLHYNPVGDLDLVSGRLVVRRTLWNGQEGLPKGGRSREVPLCGTALAALKRHRHLKSYYVFCGPDGSRLTHSIVKSIVPRTRYKAELAKR